MEYSGSWQSPLRLCLPCPRVLRSATSLGPLAASQEFSSLLVPLGGQSQAGSSLHPWFPPSVAPEASWGSFSNTSFVTGFARVDFSQVYQVKRNQSMKEVTNCFNSQEKSDIDVNACPELGAK